MSIDQILSRFKKYFLLSFWIIIISFFLFVIISPNIIFPLTFSDFFLPFIGLMAYALILIRSINIAKNKINFILLIFSAFLAIFLMFFSSYYSKYLFIFSLVWFVPFFILWYGVNKFKELNKFGKFGCLLVTVSIFSQFIIYLYGPCLGVFGYLNKYLCPENATFLFYILGLIWFFIIISFFFIISGKKYL